MSWPMGCNACDVSIVIPTRGRPELLKRAIRSALGQTCTKLEVIVVLDGEDKSTQDMVALIGDPRVRLLTLHTSVGGSEARNTGARAALGRYIALLDDDDEWLPDKLAKQLVVADASRFTNFVVVTQYLYRKEGQADEVWPGHLPKPGEPLSEFLFSSRGGFQTSTYLCPRELFLRMPFTPGLKKHQDWDWFLSLTTLQGFQLFIVAEPLSIYWVPSFTRVSVSGINDWKSSQLWAKSRFSAMTRKAYGLFLVKICARGAAMQGRSPREMLHLLRELFFVAKPTPSIFCEFLAAMLIPENVRLRLRYSWKWFQGFVCSDRTNHFTMGRPTP